jgi:hypothetical protein
VIPIVFYYCIAKIINLQRQICKRLYYLFKIDVVAGNGKALPSSWSWVARAWKYHPLKPRWAIFYKFKLLFTNNTTFMIMIYI